MYDDFKILIGPSKGSYINYVMHLSGGGGGVRQNVTVHYVGGKVGLGQRYVY